MTFDFPLIPFVMSHSTASNNNKTLILPSSSGCDSYVHGHNLQIPACNLAHALFSLVDGGGTNQSSHLKVMPWALIEQDSLMCNTGSYPVTDDINNVFS